MTDQHLTVEQVDPRTLLVYLNVRSDAALDKDLLASVRDLGVLVPIVAVRTEDGALRVRYGHRRALAAVEVGRATVPVIVTGADGADEAARIVTQWHEHRAGLSTADKVAAVEQLSLLGLSAAQIVKQTRARKADVEQALATAGSALAKGAATRYEFLTLDQAAAVAEFSEPETVKAHIASARASDGDFAHAAAGARRARSRRPGRRPAGRAGRGQRPSHRAPRLRRAARHKGPRGAGHRQGQADRPGQPRLLPRPRRLHRQRGAAPGIVYVCTQWGQAGHRERYNSGGRSASAPMTEAEEEPRREVIANKKAWKSSETVRREWLKRFLTRKSAPKGACVYLAGELARGIHELRRGMERSHQLAATLLGRDHATGRDVLAAATGSATDARAVVIALGVVLGDIEESTGPHSWRNPSDTVRRYFTFLAENGYALSDVEKLAASGPACKRGRGPAAPGNATAAA